MNDQIDEEMMEREKRRVKRQRDDEKKETKKEKKDDDTEPKRVETEEKRQPPHRRERELRRGTTGQADSCKGMKAIILYLSFTPFFPSLPVSLSLSPSPLPLDLSSAAAAAVFYHSRPARYKYAPPRHRTYSTVHVLGPTHVAVAPRAMLS